MSDFAAGFLFKIMLLYFTGTLGFILFIAIIFGFIYLIIKHKEDRDEEK